MELIRKPFLNEKYNLSYAGNTNESINSINYRSNSSSNLLANTGFTSVANN